MGAVGMRLYIEQVQDLKVRYLQYFRVEMRTRLRSKHASTLLLAREPIARMHISLAV